MSNPSPIDDIPEIKNPTSQPMPKSPEVDEEEEEYWPLSENQPYFDVILKKSHVYPKYYLYLPNKLHPLLSAGTTQAVLTYKGKSWETAFSRYTQGTVLLRWKLFVGDNDLKIGDACVFEVAESCTSRLKLKVQIFRCDIPSELLAKVSGAGETSNDPIVLD